MDNIEGGSHCKQGNMLRIETILTAHAGLQRGSNFVQVVQKATRCVVFGNKKRENDVLTIKNRKERAGGN